MIGVEEKRRGNRNVDEGEVDFSSAEVGNGPC